MARYMPFVIGALVAVCTACVFGCFSVGGVPGCPPLRVHGESR